MKRPRCETRVREGWEQKNATDKNGRGAKDVEALEVSLRSRMRVQSVCTTPFEELRARKRGNPRRPYPRCISGCIVWMTGKRPSVRESIARRFCTRVLATRIGASSTLGISQPVDDRYTRVLSCQEWSSCESSFHSLDLRAKRSLISDS